MSITLSTPALLFSAISLLLLAYTNRFLALANLIRTLHTQYKENPQELILDQIANLKRRIRLIRNMQLMGALSFFLCVGVMVAIVFQLQLIAEITFFISLILLMISLGLSVLEINISVVALELHLSDIDKGNQHSKEVQK